MTVVAQGRSIVFVRVACILLVFSAIQSFEATQKAAALSYTLPELPGQAYQIKTNSTSC